MNKYKTVDEFIRSLDSAKQHQVQTLRRYILHESPKLAEHIKWNAPSYQKDSEDRITFNVAGKDGFVKLVLHMGATRAEDKRAAPLLDDAALVEWVSDIRGYMTFKTIGEIVSNEKEIKRTIRNWLTLP